MEILQPPPKSQACVVNSAECQNNGYNINLQTWAADIHLISTYIFLDKEEQRVMAQNSHKILIKQIHTHDIDDIVGTKIVKLESKDLVSNYMWRFRRSDVNERNEWNNYTNLKYIESVGMDAVLQILNSDNDSFKNLFGDVINKYKIGWRHSPFIRANMEIDNTTGIETTKHKKNILLNMGITLGGVYREKFLMREFLII